MPSNSEPAAVENEAGENVAAAFCYLVAADPASLDPDDELAGSAWPFPVAFEPADNPVDNLRLALAYIDLELTRLLGSRV